ncbi:hypothetical protein IWW38_004738, partial [Coemansia aciculifera]
MIRSCAIAVLALSMLASLATAYTTIMMPNSQECYLERMKVNDHFSISFETAGKMPIEFF